ncbi:uncharacterized protein K02A2.6-like [Bacillus rossius redtenbacheri]|uniref:uncharacterized protein K02A2.6-like n=1 Tax=Bacillus rossius redtenbacheri TaxID=93214 RepID=UPI002FDDD9D5
MAELRRLSAHCNFVDLNRMLRDRVVCGVRDKTVQHAMLAKDKLTFQAAIDMATAAETASRNVSDLQGEVRELAETVSQVSISKSRAVHERAFLLNRSNPPQEQKPCWRCNGLHNPESCKYRKTMCNFCGKLGHLERACLNKKHRTHARDMGKNPKRNQSSGNYNVVFEGDSSEEASEYSLFNFQSQSPKSQPPIRMTVHVDGMKLDMEVDTGSGFSIISKDTFERLWPEKPSLQEARLLLHTWSQEKLRVLGVLDVYVQTKSATARLPLLVAEGRGPSLLGRSWLEPLGISVEGVFLLQPAAVADIVRQHPGVFASVELGHYKGPPVNIELDSEATPVFQKCRSVAFALRESVCKEIDRLVELGVYEPVTYSQWATPLHVVRKADGTVRLCGDYKCTVNTMCKKDVYPLPTINEAFYNLAGGKVFTKLDLADAYLQVSVDTATAELLTVNTMKGLFRVKRLPFGINCAPAVFQRLMETFDDSRRTLPDTEAVPGHRRGPEGGCFPPQ